MTEPTTVTPLQAVETLAQMVKDGYERIAELEQEIAKYVWATKTRYRVEYKQNSDDDSQWRSTIGSGFNTIEDAREAAPRWLELEYCDVVRIVKVETMVIETVVTQ